MKNKNSKSTKSVTVTATRGPGRPRAAITVPNKKFTFANLVEVNKQVTPLTLRKFLKRDMFRSNGSANPKATIMRVKDENREPNHAEGLGRKTFVYVLKAKASAPKSNGLKAATKSTASVNVGTSAATADYEATKAALLAPTPMPEPAAEAPAPEVTESATAPEVVSVP